MLCPPRLVRSHRLRDPERTLRKRRILGLSRSSLAREQRQPRPFDALLLRLVL